MPPGSPASGMLPYRPIILKKCYGGNVPEGFAAEAGGDRGGQAGYRLTFTTSTAQGA